MTNQTSQFYCKLCEKEFKHANAFSQDLHIRRFHDAKIIGDAVKLYTKEIIEDLT